MTTDDEDIRNSGIEAAREANVFCLINGPRDTIESKDFNLLENFINKYASEVPQIVYLDNVSKDFRIDTPQREKERRMRNDLEVLQTFLGYVDRNRTNASILPNITGQRRSVIFDVLLRNTVGFAFMGPGYESPFSSFMGPSNDDPYFIEYCRQYYKERLLLKSKLWAHSRVSIIQDNLSRNSLNGWKSDLPHIRELIEKQTQKTPIKPKQKVNCKKVIERLGAHLSPVTIPANRQYWKDIASVLLPPGTFQRIVDSFFEVYMDICVSILEEELRWLFKLDENYDFTDEDDGDDEEAVRGKQLAPHQYVFRLVRKHLKQYQEAKTVELGDLITDVLVKFGDYLHKSELRPTDLGIGYEETTLKVKVVKRMIGEFLMAMPRKRWTKEASQLIREHLFSPNCLLQQLYIEFTRLVNGSSFDHAKTEKLKKELEAWSERRRKSQPSASVINEGEEIEWEELPLKTSELLRADIFEDNPTNHFSDAGLDENEVIIEYSTHEELNDDIIPEIRAQHDENYSCLEIYMYSQWQEDIKRIMDEEDSK